MCSQSHKAADLLFCIFLFCFYTLLDNAHFYLHVVDKNNVQYRVWLLSGLIFRILVNLPFKLYQGIEPCYGQPMSFNNLVQDLIAFSHSFYFITFFIHSIYCFLHHAPSGSIDGDPTTTYSSLCMCKKASIFVCGQGKGNGSQPTILVKNVGTLSYFWKHLNKKIFSPLWTWWIDSEWACLSTIA